jgi:hypothetical protein
MTQQNAAMAESSSSAAKVLGEQVGELERLVGFFSLEDGAASPEPAPEADAGWSAQAAC